jgi:hypothetical protein
VALRFLWPFDLCYSGHVSCILLPRGRVHLTFLLLRHHVVYCAQFLHVYRAIRQYLCIHDQRSRSIDWWYIHDSKFDIPYYGYEVRSCAWLCTHIYIPCSTFSNFVFKNPRTSLLMHATLSSPASEYVQ